MLKTIESISSRSGQLNGTTVAGAGAVGTIALSFPSGVVLDGNGYLFIADTDNIRIVGSGPNGFRCVAGCAQSPGAEASQLVNPYSLSFDSSGKLLCDRFGQSADSEVLVRQQFMW